MSSSASGIGCGWPCGPGRTDRARCATPGALAAASGSLFIRSYERGERVYLAMLSRGYTGVMPETAAPAPVARQWFAAGVLVLICAAIATVGWVTR